MVHLETLQATQFILYYALSSKYLLSLIKQIVDTNISYDNFLFQSVFHKWCKYYTVCGMVHLKDPLLLIRVAHVMAAGFLYHSLNGPLPNVGWDKMFK